METPIFSQKPATFSAMQNLADIYDMHPQIMSCEKPSTLQNLSKPQYQVSSISTSSEAFPTYQVAQTLPNSQNFTSSISQTLMGSHVSMVPQISTTQVLPVINIEPAFDHHVYTNDWLISDGNPLGESPYVCGSQSREMAPLHTTSNLTIESQTCLSDLSQTYCDKEPLEDVLFNYQNNCMPPEQAVEELAFDTTNGPNQVISIQDIPNYENGSQCINQDWSENITMQQCHSTSSTSGLNDKQINTLEYQVMHTLPGPQATPYVQTTQLNLDRKNSREGRKMIEKQRRDKLNQSIAELSYLVPHVANSNRKFDKTSILRLSAHYLRSYNYVFGDVKPAAYPGFTASSVKTTLSLLKGFLLTTTYKGIVVLVSHNVSEYLGYNEVDLLGHNILNIIHENDTYIITEQLKPNPEMLGPNGELIIPDEPGAEEKIASQLAQDKRKFIVRFKRSGQRSHPNQYVSCCVDGSFRKSDKARGFTQPLRRIRTRATNPCSSGNDIVFIGVVRPIADNIHAEKRIESFHTEYITYHSIDGEITECDKRISLATGYMTQEVMGINAMNFIHRDDVQWVVIALQQMYDKHSLFSESFYRLMIKNGQFVYMRTRGYLQVDDSSGIVNTLICNNTIVEEEEEGERMLKMMKHKYSASVNQKMENDSGNMENPKSPVAVVDPKDLLNAVFRMIKNLPPSPKDSTENDMSSACHSSSVRITYKPPKKERIVSAIQKMYSFIKTFQQDIQQVQHTLNNQRSLNLMTNNNSLPELEYIDTNLSFQSPDIKGSNNNNTKTTYIFGNDTFSKRDSEYQSHSILTKTRSKDDDNEKCNELSVAKKQGLRIEQNKQETTIKAYCNTANLDTLQNICKIGNKRTNEHTDRIIRKKKVIDYENLDQSQIDLSTQDKPLDSYFSDEDLQRHIDQTLEALTQNESPSLADLIDFDEFLKEFDT